MPGKNQIYNPSASLASLAHTELTDMPDLLGTNSDHDTRYDARYLKLDCSNGPLTGDLASNYDISALSLTIGANTLTTTEWAFLDGQDQTIKTTSSPTFVGLLTPIINDTATQDLKLFSTGTIGNTTNGKRLYVYRVAAEGTQYIDLYVDQYQRGYLDANAGMVFSSTPMSGGNFAWDIYAAPTATYMGLTTSALTLYKAINLLINSNSSSGNPYLQIQGYITAPMAAKYSRQYIDDVNDEYLFTLQDANLTGYAFQLSDAVGVSEFRIRDSAGVEVASINSDGHYLCEGVISTGATGTGKFVFDTSPALVTPTIGVATATSIAIGANTLDTSEWAFLDGQDQAVKTTSSPTFANITNSGLTITRIPFASTAGLLVDNANFIYTTASSALQNTGLAKFIAGAAVTVPLTIQGAAAQSENLTNWQDSTSAILAFVHPNGDAGFAHMSVGLGTGTVGNGVGVSANTVLNVDETWTPSAGGLRRGIYVSFKSAGSAPGNPIIQAFGAAASWEKTNDSAGSVRGLQFTAGNVATAGNMGLIMGARFAAGHYATSKIATTVIGGQFEADNYSITGTVNTLKAGEFLRISKVNSIVDSSTGVYIADIAPSGGVGTATINYGLYVEPILVGTTSIGVYIGDGGTYALQLASTDGDAASGITWATDTNLYRSAANTLRTNNIFIAGTNIGIGKTPAQALDVLGNIFRVSNAGNANTQMLLDRFSTSSARYPYASFRKSHNDTIDVWGTTLTDEYLGAIAFWGTDAQATPTVRAGASITVMQDGDATATCVPARIEFYTADTGAYALRLTIKGNGSLVVPTTITAVGTTGNQTINKVAGRVNIAAGGTTVTVTNSLVTANSIIVAVAATADTTAKVTSVVPAAGSFVINTVAVTAETAFNWIVIS